MPLLNQKMLIVFHKFFYRRTKKGWPVNRGNYGDVTNSISSPKKALFFKLTSQTFNLPSVRKKLLIPALEQAENRARAAICKANLRHYC